MPEPLDPRPALDEEPGHLPAPIADGVVERATAGDRCPGGLDVGTTIDQRPGYLDVVAARRPVQRGFGVPAPLHGGVGVGAGLDQHRHDLRAPGEETWPIGGRVQRGPRAALVVHDARGPQASVLPEQLPQALDLSGMDYPCEFLRNWVFVREPQPLPSSEISVRFIIGTEPPAGASALALVPVATHLDDSEHPRQ